ncbi:hypothetical protein A2U01_0016076, partial [Trifolium medium]|nr:hypothetical protein [Trifolium medium]
TNDGVCRILCLCKSGSNFVWSFICSSVASLKFMPSWLRAEGLYLALVATQMFWGRGLFNTGHEPGAWNLLSNKWKAWHILVPLSEAEKSWLGFELEQYQINISVGVLSATCLGS